MFEDHKISTRGKISALWITLMLFYIYADLFTLYRPGGIGHFLQGNMGLLEVSQGASLIAAGLMAIPALMVILTLVLPVSLCRWSNVVLGLLYTLVNAGNIVDESWLYYLAYGGIEIVLTLMIAYMAWSWPRV